METKFYGSFQELKKVIKQSGYLGGWVENTPESRVTFRFNNGAVLNWWPSSGTVQFQGKLEAREEARAAVTPLLLKKQNSPFMILCN
ncbi:hypothetical protein FACS189460_0930 [Deltaproteobacteria bacterium]|nr:hypothetical protein FACS189460_0930 [Deltaproteobacteria bacterium]